MHFLSLILLTYQVKDPGFESYGHSEIDVIANHFYGREVEEEKEVTKASTFLAQWQKFKYEMATWKKQVPQALLEAGGKRQADSSILTTTDWTLQRLLARRSTYKDTYSELLMIAEAACTMPLSNCGSERGGSAIKRIKSRMRTRLTDDMLSALLHVSINGPSFGTEECSAIVQRAEQLWSTAKKRRKPRLDKGKV